MNKETRMFIWGLILFLICGTATALTIADIIKLGFTIEWYRYVMLFFTTYGAFSGGNYIRESLEN